VLLKFFLYFFYFLSLRQHLLLQPHRWPFLRPSSSCLSPSRRAPFELSLDVLPSSPPSTTSLSSSSSSLAAVRSGVQSLLITLKGGKSYTVRISIPADVGLEATSASSYTTTSPFCRREGDEGGKATEERAGGQYTKSSGGGGGQTPVNSCGVTKGVFSPAQERFLRII
jgi:hypothetical protein